MMDSIENQIDALKNTLAKKLYEEIFMIERIHDEKIKDVYKNSKLQLAKMKNIYDCEYAKGLEEKFNKLISQNIVEINKAILELKNELFNDFFESIQYAYSNIISERFEEYKKFIRSRIRIHLSKFDSDVLIYANMRDIDFIKEKIPSIIERTGFKHNIKVVDTPIDTVGGFIISDEEKTFSIDWRFETIVRLYQDNIALLIEKAFPFYIDKRETALNLLEKCQRK
jgi:vacuolar-type H+-ATPase subunit E/Vma4